MINLPLLAELGLVFLLLADPPSLQAFEGVFLLRFLRFPRLLLRFGLGPGLRRRHCSLRICDFEMLTV